MSRPLKVFLCHASDDKEAVRQLYARLKSDGISPWLDERDLLPGQNWQIEIPNAVRDADVVLVCLSENSVNKEGFIQKEITFALDKALEMPEGRIFLIPARLESCDVPRRLNSYHWVDLFEKGGYENLMRSLRFRAKSVGAELQPKKSAIGNVFKKPITQRQDKIKTI